MASTGDDSTKLAPAKYSDADAQAIERCLLAVQHQSEKREQEGLSKTTFALGVLNALFVAWAAGAIPEHFWIIYIVETLILYPARWVIMGNAKPLDQRPFWLDFCWFANFTAFAGLGLCAADKMFGDSFGLGHQVRERLFCIAWSIACGILASAAVVLGNALLFHDASNLVSLFIHMFPTLLMYTFRHNTAEIKAAWPGIFELDYFDTVDVWKDVYLSGLLFYIFWWVLYTGLLLTCMRKFPESGYDTIFHFTMRTNPTAVAVVMKISPALGGEKPSAEEVKRRISENDWDTQHALCYMICHGSACTIALLVAVPTWKFWQVHAALNFFLVVTSVWNGAARYSHYMLRSYADIIRKELRIGKDGPVPRHESAESDEESSPLNSRNN
jgi:hypothetical protein